jgi:O-antigen/teichoic acid export membrane protein
MVSGSRFYFAASPLAGATLGFVSMPLMTWTLPSQTIAQYGLFQYACSVALLIVTCGLDQVFLRELNTTASTGALLRRCLVPCACIFALLCLACWAASGPIARQFSPMDAAWLSTAFCVNVALLTLHRFGAQKARLSDQGAHYFAAELLLKLPLALLLVAALVTSETPTSTSPFMAALLGTGLGACVLLWRNRRLVWSVFTAPAEPRLSGILQLLAFGLPLAIAGVMYWTLASAGAYVLQATHGADATAGYVVATSLSNAAAIGQAMFSLMWLPVVYRQLDKGVRPTEIAEAARKTMLGAAVVYIALVALVHSAQHLLGEGFRAVAPIAAALCVMPVLYTVSEVTFIGLMITRRSSAAMVATGVALVVGVACNLFLTPALGATGAALSVVVSAQAFMTARTEASALVWRPIARARVYFGSVSVAAAGAASVLLPPDRAWLALAALAPYLCIERRLAALLLVQLLQHGHNSLRLLTGR